MAMQTWFVVRGGKEEGPYTGTQLKDMAASGTLKPTDQVRRADVETARPASAIKGLFPAEEEAGVAWSPKPPASQPTSAAPATKKRLVIMAAVAAVLVLLCGGVGVLVTVFNKEKQAAQKELAEADGLWATDKGGAAAKYRAILQNRSHKAALKGELAPVYGRLIDYETEQGNREAAKALLDEALPPSHTLPCHGCGAFVPMDLFGDSRVGDRPGRCPACSCSLDTAFWDAQFDAAQKRLRKCSCGKGRCLPSGGAGNRRVKFWFLKIYVTCSGCNGSGRCQVCFDGLYDPKELQLRSMRGEIRKPPEPTYTDFVPPPDWIFWCPVCGARLQSGTNVVCWHCNYGA